MSEKDNPGFVTRSEFNLRFGKVELGLFGADGRGGMVKDVNDIKSVQRVILDNLRLIEKYRNEEKQDEKQKTLLSNKWKMTIYGSIFGTCGLVIIELLKFVTEVLL